MSATEERQRWSAGVLVTPTVRLVAPLGAGGMGAVWVAEHTGLRTKVVVKFMHDELDGSDSARSRFSREATAAAQIKSPHVVQMLDHGVTDDGAPFIVMEYLEGRNLGEVLRDEGALPAEEVVAIVTQVARALSRVHAAELLHRDVKPENIFLCDGDGETFVKLLDFGIVKSNRDALDTQTKTGQVVGTPFYMSPEQMMGQKEIDARSDLWSLGVVAYECLTGKRPFDGPSFGAVAVNIATGAPTPPSEAIPAIPVTVDAWFQRACARAPADRFASAKDLADGLREAFGSAISAPLSSVATSFDESKPDRALARTVAEGARAAGTKSSSVSSVSAASSASSTSSASSASREAIGLAKTEFGLEGGLSKTARPSSKVGVFVAAFSLVVGAGGAVFFLANRNAEGDRASAANRAAPTSTSRTSAPPNARGAAPKAGADPSSDLTRAASNDERSQVPSSHGDGRATSSRSASKAAAPELGDAAVDESSAPDSGEVVAASPDAGASSSVASSPSSSAAVKPTEPEPSPESRDAQAPETRRDAATKTW